MGNCEMYKIPNKYKFVGDHPKLTTGASYSLPEVGRIIDINPKTMHSRMRGKTEITNAQLGPVQTKFRNGDQPDHWQIGGHVADRLENQVMKLSQQWLGKAL